MWDHRSAADLPLAKQLAKHGLKLTRPRLAIVQVLSEYPGHLSTQEIWERARSLYRPLGRATTFRTIHQMVLLGLLRPLPLGKGEQRYMVVRGGHHHHVICTHCGSMVELPECPLVELAEEVAASSGFRITGHLVEFFGLCHECQNIRES
ncbi:MAG: transcriptional repressor [Chloroflexi bacterium]|nr:transcriptional repressor [Chloroflexota bacterium]